MLITTTDSLEGHPIKRYIGFVSGEAIVGANFVKDWLASISDVIGGRVAGYESALADARSAAFAVMIKEAEEYEANAIVGVSVDCEAIGNGGSMLLVSVSGTAVRLQAL